MGALGWSEGAGVSSVVCATPVMENAPASANVKIAKLARSLLFIANLLLTGGISRFGERQLLCQKLPDVRVVTPLFPMPKWAVQ
jgi:hypothetical protein